MAQQELMQACVSLQKEKQENKMIKLNDLLNLSEEEISNTKIRLMVASNGSGDPHQEYIDNSDEITKGWFLWQQEKQKTIFQENNIGIGLLRISNDRWLFVTAQKILRNLNRMNAGVNYETEVINEMQKYFGRIVLRYHNTSQNMCRRAVGLIEDLEISEILPSKYEGKIFPGYENVTLSWQELRSIIDYQKQDWITALKHQKGVYLITDAKTGKLYVGSAYGENMILQRWSCYIETGHGGNIGLRKMPFEYIKENFQYSILETYNSTTPDDRIINRESWWKNALKSREFGYNAN